MGYFSPKYFGAYFNRYFKIAQADVPTKPPPIVGMGGAGGGVWRDPRRDDEFIFNDDEEVLLLVTQAFLEVVWAR